MIASLFSTNIARGIDNILSGYVITPNNSDHPLTACARKISLAELRNKSAVLRVLDIQKIRITSEHLAPADTTSGGDYRPSMYSVSSIEMSQSLHPISLELSIEMQNQSNLAHILIAKRIIRVYCQDLREIKLSEMLMKGASVYSCRHGTNKKAPTEISWIDLCEISSMFSSRGAIPVFSQQLSTVQISTSSIPKAYMLLSSAPTMRKILQNLDAINTRSFIASNQFAGASNYAQNVYGVEISSRMSFISSNNFTPVEEAGGYRFLAIAGDSYLLGRDLPTTESIHTQDAMILSPIGINTRVSSACPYSGAISRLESLFQGYASNK